jgi:8-oxo-dGTP pyrophosphatase MutT (NUDIX family)
MSLNLKSRNDFSSGGVVYDPSKKELLVIKVESLSKAIVWTFPKGHPELKESDQEAALREVLEETGWECRILKHLLDVDYFYVHDGVRTHKTVRWFLMEPVKKTGQFNQGEVLDCQWIPIQEAKNLISYDSDRKLLKTLEV